MTADEATIETLRRWSHILLWTSVILPFLGAVAAGVRYYVERTERRIVSRLTSTAIDQAHNEALQARSEAALANTEQAKIATELSESKAELLDLQKRTAPRHVTAEQRARLVAGARRLHGASVVLASRMMDGESLDFAGEIAGALREGGCEVPDIVKTSLNDLPGLVAVSNYGSADPELLKALERMLRDAGIPTERHDIADSSIGSRYRDVPHLVVGRKKP